VAGGGGGLPVTGGMRVAPHLVVSGPSLCEACPGLQESHHDQVSVRAVKNANGRSHGCQEAWATWVRRGVRAGGWRAMLRMSPNR